MELQRVWDLLSTLSMFDLAWLAALTMSVFVSACFAIYMYSTLIVETLRTRRSRRSRVSAWIEGHTRRRMPPPTKDPLE
jgi:hypothetical protein